MVNVPLNSLLSYRLNLLSESAAKIVSRVYEREVDLTLRELRVLRTVGSFPGIAPTEMVERVLFEKSLASRVLSGLVKKSYLNRELDPTDARRLALVLTKKGTAILRKADELGLAMNQTWLSALTPAEQKGLDVNLEKLMAGLANLAERFDAR